MVFELMGTVFAKRIPENTEGEVLKMGRKFTSALLAGFAAASLSLCAFAGEAETITVAASSTPHAEVLEFAKPILEEQGYDLEITVFDDYIQPNNVVDSGEIDANYFQHLPYLEDFNAENGTKVVSIGAIHVEPMGLYGGKQTTLDALK